MSLELFKRCFVIAVMFLWLATPGDSVLAGPQIPGLSSSVGPSAVSPTQLPVNGVPVYGISSMDTNSPTSTLTIHQNQSSALINWQSFNIGEKATVHFDQQGNRSWGVLNRIYDQNPTQIMGKLSADGKVYLINQNGILFGPKSQVNTHTMVASTLNVTDNDFKNRSIDSTNGGSTTNDYGVIFQSQDNNGNPVTPNLTAAVINQGNIQTDSQGSVFLMAPNVQNSGTINTPVGQIGLAAGTNVQIFPDTTINTTRTALVVKVSDNFSSSPGYGTAVNDLGAGMIADTGWIGMYGNAVYQNGLIQADSVVQKNGHIELLAQDLISTGPGSQTLCPISISTDKVVPNNFTPGVIQLGGIDLTKPRPHRPQSGSSNTAGQLRLRRAP